ncbi:MAG: hypothetical protein H2212_03620 [Ruminococcus sp.]|nr:hypothetical protein [Ruminococcus sp.]
MHVSLIRTKDKSTNEQEAIFYPNVIDITVVLDEEASLIDIIITENEHYKYPLSEIKKIHCRDEKLWEKRIWGNQFGKKHGFFSYSRRKKALKEFDEFMKERLMMKRIEFYARGELNYIYVPEIVSLSESVYEVRFDVGIKEKIKCAGTYEWKMFHQETNEVVTVDTETIYKDVSAFYEYTLVAKYGPKIFSIKKL